MNSIRLCRPFAARNFFLMHSKVIETGHKETGGRYYFVFTPLETSGYSFYI